MTAFVTNGPDIPESLLQAHEEGRVVFFCGAGISTPAGLPLFKGLVDEIYEQLHAVKMDDENKSYEKKQYDVTLDQLEQRYPGQRLAVRKTLETILKPRGATTTHQALLQLATDRKGSARIVTTNFDRIFQSVIARKKLDIPIQEAPGLPIPKPNRWCGLVHLHGLLPDRSDDAALNRLVLSSGDFGSAYLSDGWAARFISGLFQYYVVCFVGYGINDPVVHYMMKAFATEELLGGAMKEVYAFASFEDGKKQETLAEWGAKGVIPLLYEAPRGGEGIEDHSAFHKTLEEWANTYRDGVRGKEAIIEQHARTPPSDSSRSNFAVGRVLWALTDEQAAKHFANLNPVPPLEWLQPFTEAQFGHQDLSRFGIVSNGNENKELHFSILRRPAHYIQPPWMCIVDTGARGSDWDGAMFQLARWLTRHLGDPRLILWLAKQGGQLRGEFANLIRERLEYLERLDAEEEQEELNRICDNALEAIPGLSMRTLWRLFLTGQIRSHTHHLNFLDWLRRIKQDGVTLSLRMELREILKPYVVLRPRFDWGEGARAPSEPPRIKDLVDWELVLASDHVHYALQDWKEKPEWREGLPNLLQDFTALLRDALDLRRELDDADERNDLSYIHQPSISEHSQNKDLYDWTALIELTRDAWLEIAQTDHTQARHAAEGWWQVPYPIFKRLGLFAATQHNVISQRQALDWLLAEDYWWLWSVETQRESLRLLMSLAPKLDVSEIAELEYAILKGPPREMFKNDIEPDEWTRMVERTIWLRLAKIQATGTVLSQVAKTKLDELAQQYPRWRLAEDESDEFPFRMEDGEEWREFFQIPRQYHKLVKWVKGHNTLSWPEEDEWKKFCRDDFPTTARVLRALAEEDVWPANHWSVALQAWSEEQLNKQSWHDIGLVLNNAPDDLIQTSVYAISWWLQAIAKTFEGHEVVFLNLCQRVLEVDPEDVEEVDGPVGTAINHPVGQVARALLYWWHRKSPKDGQGLPETLEPTFTKLCNTKIEKFRHGRVLLSAHVVALYRVDHDWATKHLLPLFDWSRLSVEARSAWAGFLWLPRLYQPLLSDIKDPMLETAKHYRELGRYAKQYATLLTYVALDTGGIFTTEELAAATKRLPQDGLESTVQTLTRALEKEKDQRGDYWRNHLLPYFQTIWPQSRDLIKPRISWEFARLCTVAGEAFPEVLEKLQHWLSQVEDSYSLVHFMHETDLCKQFPEDALKFLNVIVRDNVQFPLKELQECLNGIQQADQELAQDNRFSRLDNLVRKHSI